MTRRFKLWRIVASLFTLVNLAGGAFALASGEPRHAALHACLLLLGVYWMSRLASRAGAGAEPDPFPPEERLDRLQQKVEAIALDVERIGESQRFMARLYHERARTTSENT